MVTILLALLGTAAEIYWRQGSQLARLRPIPGYRSNEPLANRENLQSAGRRNTPPHFRVYLAPRAHELRGNRYPKRGHAGYRLAPPENPERSGTNLLPAPRAVRVQRGSAGNGGKIYGSACENGASQEKTAAALIEKKRAAAALLRTIEAGSSQGFSSWDSWEI